MMRWIANLLYLGLLTALAPVIGWRIVRHGRYRRGLAEKLLGRIPFQRNDRPIVWFHAVSVGEVIQLQKIVDEFRRQTSDAFQILVTTSTDTGFDLAINRFAGCQVSWFPLDFTWAVSTALNRIQPSMIVLMELELWPNFLQTSSDRDIPVAVINARMSERSHRRYQRIRRILTPIFGSLSLVAAQSRSSADRLLSLGVDARHLRLTGSIKFDGVDGNRENSKTQSLRRFFDIRDDEVVLMAGSTQEPEEQLAIQTWLALRDEFPHLRLLIVPRHKERFDAVAELIQSHQLSVIRRSQKPAISGSVAVARSKSSVLLLDTIGELSACWGLAEIAFVGGSFGNRGGQNMIEPASYGACVMFGPNTWNFRDVVARFSDAGACLQLDSPEQMLPTVRSLLTDPERCRETGRRAREVVLSQQGAVQKTVDLLIRVTSETTASHNKTSRAA
jgi:3-deoxy-D-manno-octulosonic-acid transferase